MKVFNLGNMTSKEKTDMRKYFEQILVNQAYSQHLQNVPDLSSKGLITGYDINGEDECLYIKYENGEVWRYQNIDLGAEGMSYKLVENNK